MREHPPLPNRESRVFVQAETFRQCQPAPRARVFYLRSARKVERAVPCTLGSKDVTHHQKHEPTHMGLCVPPSERFCSASKSLLPEPASAGPATSITERTTRAGRPYPLSLYQPCGILRFLILMRRGAVLLRPLRTDRSNHGRRQDCAPNKMTTHLLSAIGRPERVGGSD